MNAPPRQRRVVITGMGAITCAGLNKEDLWASLLSGKTGIGPLKRFAPVSCRARCAGEINNFDPARELAGRRCKRMDRHTQLALACALHACADAGLSAQPPPSPNPRWGASLGTALGGIADAEQQHAIFLREGLRGISACLAIQIYGGASSSNLSIELGLRGPCFTSSNSCASGAIAIGEAFRYIRDGYADLMVAGGAEAPLQPLTFGAFDLIHTMSSNPDPQNACRPFDAQRDGFVMAEGAAMLILESEEHALSRGVQPCAELAGYSLNSDAHHMTASLPGGEAAARCMTQALQDAGLTPREVDYVNAHASSTPMNDRNETRAIKRAFGNHASRLAISGTKACYGHPLGASGAIETVLCAMAIRHQCLPPTLNLLHPDPDCDLDYVPLTPRSAPIRSILSNSFGFGGVNACLVLKKTGRIHPPSFQTHAT
ncbi:MAG: beta-ketoacyl-[acyl-carrier-protein] synthase family protein [Verrucomicrobiae bacterium]|nr:beta-ketoacyl-[acyl-carrier-protein] synthase family protein [Verrucomicrobiae bacterium]